MKAYFSDSGIATGVHQGFVEHEELDLTDEELAKLKGRAKRALTMDGSPDQPGTPQEYLDYLGQNKNYSYDKFLRGESHES